jgi:chromosomal replication initiation ATPase DnaA
LGKPTPALGEDAFVEKSLARAEQTVNRQPSTEGVIEVVCSVFGLTTAEITSRSRVRRISEARGVDALLVRKEAAYHFVFEW